PQRVALRAHHRAALGAQALGMDHVRLAFRGVPLAGAVADLAARAEVHPPRAVVAGGRLVALLLLADVAPDAVGVPDLDPGLGRLLGVDDLHVVEPLPPADVPARGQDHDPAVLEGG